MITLWPFVKEFSENYRFWIISDHGWRRSLEPVKVDVSFQKPVSIRLLIFLIILLAYKSTSKLFADFYKVFVSLYMIEFQAFMHLPIAYRTQINWMFDQLRCTKPFHQTFIIRTMSYSKHMSQLMRCYFNYRHKHSLLFLLFGLIIGTSKVFTKSPKTVNTTKSWHSIPISIGLEFLGTYIDVRKWKYCDAVRFGILNGSNDFSQYLNGIILLFSLWINLRANLKLFVVENWARKFR